MLPLKKVVKTAFNGNIFEKTFLSNLNYQKKNRKNHKGTKEMKVFFIL